MSWQALLAERLQPHTLYEVTLAPDTGALADLVIKTLHQTSGLELAELAFLKADWWCWDEVTTVVDPDALNRKYAGRVMRRIGKALSDRCAAHLDNATSAALSALLATWFAGQGTYRFDFSPQIDWDAGDFGEIGTCFWTNHKAARSMLQSDPTFRAMRFYAPDDAELRYYGSGQGIGRAWLVQRAIDELLCPVVFNGYWHAGGSDSLNHDKGEAISCTQQVARVLAQHLDATAVRVELSNYGAHNGTLYINSHQGFVIAPSAQTLPSSIDLRIFDYNQRCASCRVYLTPENCVVNPDNPAQVFCTRCAREYMHACAGCGAQHAKHQMYQRDHGYWCTRCVERVLYHCNYCEGLFSRATEPPITLGDGDYCSACYERIQTHCLLCDNYLAPDAPAHLIGDDDTVFEITERASAAPHMRRICERCYANQGAINCATCGRDWLAELTVLHPDGRVECAACETQRRVQVRRQGRVWTQRIERCWHCNRKFVLREDAVDARFCPLCAPQMAQPALPFPEPQRLQVRLNPNGNWTIAQQEADDPIGF